MNHRILTNPHTAALSTSELRIGSQQAVLSPAWSLHAGVGAARYGFCWAVGGENQAPVHMDPVTPAELR